ncbi:hypothetical protein BON30_46140 [Cystobacter ferrugineus]|uniref:Uncharacterized protein n=1 Tax=Cystobacter ferrugineus TaxID=83449 RepID=A0A1L9AV76_9BACT|nr:hypothetical protein BON30_46140 [Cystobacter ferrugineus]
MVGYFHAINPDTQKPLTERNTRMRLQRLAEDGFLKAALTQPEKGGYSGIYYRLGGKGLRALGIPEDKNLLRRPPVQVLRYLLLRNEVYAQAREAGWHVVSPTLFDESHHPELLVQVRRWFLQGAREHAAQGNRQAQRQFEMGVPNQLTFDCLLRYDAGRKRASALVLVVVDDVRRAIVPVKRSTLVKDTKVRCERCGSEMKKYQSTDSAFLRCVTARCDGQVKLPRPALAQSEDLPLFLPGAGLVLRDTSSRWNTTTQTLEWASPRLRQWRRVLARQYGKELLDTDTLFPGLWSQRTHSPGQGGSRVSSPEPEGEE